MPDWFRKKSWTTEDEKDFYARLSRAREHSRAQYLRIQAVELVETGNLQLFEVAEKLLNELLEDYPDDKFEKGSTLHKLGDIYKLRDNFDQAIEYYKKALDFEKIYPNVKTQAYLNYSELIIKSNKTELFNEVEQVILAREPYLVFPVDKYKAYSILSIINKYNRNKEQAKHFAALADQFANEQTSGLKYHKYLGVVNQRDNWLERLVNKINEK